MLGRALITGNGLIRSIVAIADVLNEDPYGLANWGKRG